MAANLNQHTQTQDSDTINPVIEVDNQNLTSILPDIAEDSPSLETLKLTEDLRAIPAESLLEAMKQNFQCRLNKAKDINQSQPKHSHLKELQISSSGALEPCFSVLINPCSFLDIENQTPVQNPVSIFEMLSIDFSNQRPETHTYSNANKAAENNGRKKENNDNLGKEPEIVITPVAALPLLEPILNANLSMLATDTRPKLTLWNLKITHGWFKTRSEQSAKKTSRIAVNTVSKNPNSVIIEELSLGLKQPSYVISALNFSNCDFSFESFKLLAEGIKGNSSLTELGFENVNMSGPAGASCLAGALQAREYPLCVLRIGFNTTAHALTQIIKVATHAQKVEHLILAGSDTQGLNDEPFEDKAAVEKIQSAFTPASTAVPIETRISQFPLRELDLSNIKFPKEVAERLFLYVKKNNNIKSLKYNGCIANANVAAQVAKYIAACLIEAESLTSLELDENHFGDKGAAIIANALASEKTLTKKKAEIEQQKSQSPLQALSLRRNDIRNFGMQRIADMLETNRTLRVLHLDGNSRPSSAFNSPDVEGYQYLAEIIELHNKTLVELSPDPSEYRGDYELGIQNSLMIIERVCHVNRALQIEKASLWARISFQIVAGRLRKQLEQELNSHFSGTGSHINNSSVLDTHIKKEEVKKEITSLVDSLWTIAHERNSDGLFETRNILQGPLAEIFKLADLPTRFATNSELNERLILQSNINQWAIAIRRQPLILLPLTQAASYLLLNTSFSIFLSDGIGKFIKYYVLAPATALMGWRVAHLNQYEQNRMTADCLFANVFLESIGMMYPPLSDVAYGHNRRGNITRLYDPRLGNYKHHKGILVSPQDVIMLFYCTLYSIWHFDIEVKNKYRPDWVRKCPGLYNLMKNIFASSHHAAFLYGITNRNIMSIPAGVILGLLEHIFPRLKELFHTLSWSAMSAKLVFTFINMLKKDIAEGKTAAWNTQALALVYLTYSIHVLWGKKQSLQFYGQKALNSIFSTCTSIPGYGQSLYRRVFGLDPANRSQVLPAAVKAATSKSPRKQSATVELLAEGDGKDTKLAADATEKTTETTKTHTPPTKRLLFRYKAGTSAEPNKASKSPANNATANSPPNTKRAKTRSCNPLSICVIS